MGVTMEFPPVIIFQSFVFGMPKRKLTSPYDMKR